MLEVEDMEEIIYITGHKNPDTDSICSAIAYAELKKKLGTKAVPIRIGDINKETEFVLRYFNIEAPEYLETVRTQVSDLSMDIVHPVSEDISIKVAWGIMQKNNVKVLPVVGEKEELLGIVTLSDITKSYMNALENNVLSASNTPLKNIVETLNAKLLHGKDEDFKNSGKVVIAAMLPESLEPYIETGDMVLVGNRKDSQMKAIELGASCIIVSCGGQIDNEVLVLAEKSHCIVMETNYDTFTAARLINQSIPVGFIMTKKELTYFNIKDFTDSVKEKMLKTRYRSYPVVDECNRMMGFISRYHLISQRRKKIVLLDHNEKTQTVDGIEQAEIIEIIDHHRIGDIQTSNPVLFKNEPLGSTSTIIANMYFENGMKPAKGIAGILCAAILSDTMKFKSPTSTFVDQITASKLAAIADIDIDELAVGLFQAASSLKDMSPEAILKNDFKEYQFDKYKVGIGQFNTNDMEGFSDIKAMLLESMEVLRKEGRYNLIVLMITDMMREGSQLLFKGHDNQLMEKAFSTESDTDSIYLKNVVSRKKQILPAIANAAEVASNL